MSRRSVCSNLIEFVNFCTGKIENGAQIHAIYTDIKKAFDTVNHTVPTLKEIASFGHSFLFIGVDSILP